MLQSREGAPAAVRLASKLVERFDPDPYGVRESALDLAARCENEDDDHEDELKIPPENEVLTNS